MRSIARSAIVVYAGGILGGVEIIEGIVSRPVGVIADNCQTAAVIII